MSRAAWSNTLVVMAIVLNGVGCVLDAPQSKRYQPSDDRCVVGNWRLDASSVPDEDLPFDDIRVSVRTSESELNDPKTPPFQRLFANHSSTPQRSYVIGLTAQRHSIEGDNTSSITEAKSWVFNGFCYHTKHGVFLLVADAPFAALTNIASGGTMFQIPVWGAYKLDIDKTGIVLKALRHNVVLPVNNVFSGPYDFKSPEHHDPDSPTRSVIAPDLDALLDHLVSRRGSDWDEPVRFEAIRE